MENGKVYRIDKIRENFEKVDFIFWSCVRAKDVEEAMDIFNDRLNNTLSIVDFTNNIVGDKYGDEYIFIELGDNEFQMTFKERKLYFNNFFKLDFNLYLMKAIDRIVELTHTEDYVAVCNELGMPNGIALDFLDGYENENGWEKDE